MLQHLLRAKGWVRTAMEKGLLDRDLPFVWLKGPRQSPNLKLGELIISLKSFPSPHPQHMLSFYISPLSEYDEVKN